MTWGRSFEQRLSFCLVVATLVVPVRASALVCPVDGPEQQATSSALPNDPSDRLSGADKDNGARPSAPLDSASPAVDQTPTQTPKPSDQTPTPTPLGTAAAPETGHDGVPGSAPAGAAIAPAKQRRVWRFSIKTALVVGAVVAVGIVAGVSLASPSRP
jgi:hypothetical protein